MSMQRSAIARNDRRVLKYRPRTSDRAPGRPLANGLEPNTAPALPDDYPQRMRVNIAAFIFAAVLTAVGIWLAFSIADMRAAQDCVLMGRRNCVTIPAPHADGTMNRARFVNVAAELP
jgi:hypothetical protein